MAIRTAGRTARWTAPLASVMLLGLLGGCATGAAGELRTAERRATVERWNACMDRQEAVEGLANARTRLESDCEGHRRDVLRAFPPHLEPRLRQMMDERTTTRVRARLGERAGEAARDPHLRSLVSSFEER